MDAVFELLDDVPLMATSLGQPNALFRRIPTSIFTLLQRMYPELAKSKLGSAS